MTAFLAELGKQVADKWLSLIVLPGLLYLSVLTAARILGQRHWHDFSRLSSALDSFQPAIGQGRPALLALWAVGVLMASAAIGIAVGAVAAVVESVWTGQWPDCLAKLSETTFRRHSRWMSATENFEAEAAKTAPERDLAVLDRNAEARNRIALAEPARSTWIGDQYAAVETRIRIEYGLNLTFIWPRLWLVLPDPVRGELRNARESFDSGTRLTAWGLSYMIITFIWWPASLVAIITIIAGWRRGRLATRSLTFLTEAAVDIYGPVLARSLGLAQENQRLTKEVGTAVTLIARKGA
ncbi:MAG: hypothetical protein WAL12_03400 [Trebonia sp.]